MKPIQPLLSSVNMKILAYRHLCIPIQGVKSYPTTISLTSGSHQFFHLARIRSMKISVRLPVSQRSQPISNCLFQDRDLRWLVCIVTTFSVAAVTIATAVQRPHPSWQEDRLELAILIALHLKIRFHSCYQFAPNLPKSSEAKAMLGLC